MKCAHEYGYELNLEIDNMCSLMKFGVLNWWHYEINMRLCASCVENEIVYVYYVKYTPYIWLVILWLLYEIYGKISECIESTSKWISSTFTGWCIDPISEWISGAFTQGDISAPPRSGQGICSPSGSGHGNLALAPLWSGQVVHLPWQCLSPS